MGRKGKAVEGKERLWKGVRGSGREGEAVRRKGEAVGRKGEAGEVREREGDLGTGWGEGRRD